MPTIDDIMTDTLEVCAHVRRGDFIKSIRLGTATPTIDGRFYSLTVIVDHLHIEKDEKITIFLKDKQAKADLRKRVIRQQLKLLVHIKANLE